MGIELDELERAVVRYLEEKRGLGFNDLLRELESRKVRVSRSGLSRRLKRLVQLEVVSREAELGWPPSTKYRIADTARSPILARIRMWGRSLTVMTLVLMVSLASLGVVCLVQYKMIADLQAELASKEGLLLQKSMDLDLKIEELKAELWRLSHPPKIVVEIMGDLEKMDAIRMMQSRARFLGISDLMIDVGGNQ